MSSFLLVVVRAAADEACQADQAAAVGCGRRDAQVLEKLEGRRLYAYLRALLSSDKDFGQRAQAATSEALELQQQTYLQEKTAAFAGQTFQSRDAKLLVTVDACGMLLEEREGRRAARPMCQTFLDAIAAGRLIARRDA